MVREELYFFTREDAREVSTKGQHASSLTFLETAHASTYVSRTTDDMNNMCTFIQQLKMKSFTNPSSN